MDSRMRRRHFLGSAAALGLGSSLSSSIQAMTPVHATEMAITPEIVNLRPEIEPTVRWIEETPRDRILDVAVERLHQGLSYRDLLAGLFLAGIRNVKPRPVGFKFHAVLVIHSAHILGQTAAVEDRLLPLFWALDNFKNSQAQDIKEGDWTLGRVDEAKVPSSTKAKPAFVDAMDAWDVDAADVAVAGLCRSAGAAEVMEPFWRYAVRDQRDIGHKAIFAAQSWRTLQAIGWQHAEPVLRSLAFGLLDGQQDAKSKPEPVGPYESNLKLAAKIRDHWQSGKLDTGATESLLATLRSASSEEASQAVFNALNEGVAPESLWDAVVLAGGELLLRSPGILAIHAVTAVNALHYIFGASGDNTTRKLALLQAAGWFPLYRDRAKPESTLKLDTLEAATFEAKGEDRLTEVFAAIAKSRPEAAAKALGYLKEGGSPSAIFAMARKLIFQKGRDSHDYKYAAAAWEEFTLSADPRWQPNLAAAMMGNLPSTGQADSPLMQRARAAMASRS